MDFIKEIIPLIEESKLDYVLATFDAGDNNINFKNKPYVLQGTRLKDGFSILVRNQDNPLQNGIYKKHRLEWKRHEEFLKGKVLKKGTATRIGYHEVCILANTGVIGEAELHFVKCKIDYRPDTEEKFFVNDIPYKKTCFGEFMLKACKGHHGCVNQDNCFFETSTKYGACDCKYKGSCHLMRQESQADWRKEDGSSVESCDFYKMIDEEAKKRKETK